MLVSVSMTSQNTNVIGKKARENLTLCLVVRELTRKGASWIMVPLAPGSFIHFACHSPRIKLVNDIGRRGQNLGFCSLIKAVSAYQVMLALCQLVAPPVTLYNTNCLHCSQY